MKKQQEIKLGRGLTNTQFGCSKEDVEKVYGEPDAIDTFESEDEFGETHVYSYDELDLAFSFEESNGFKLSSIAVNNDDYRIRDVIFTGMKKATVLNVLEELNMNDYGEEDHSDEDSPNHTLVVVDDKSLHLWFDNDVLTEVEWFPFFDEDEEIIWPS